MLGCQDLWLGLVKTRFLKTGAPFFPNWSAWKQPRFFWFPPSRPVPASKSSIFRHGGIMPTAICLSKAAIGAGVLSVSAHSAEVGAFYQLTCLLHLGIDGWTLQTVGGNFTKYCTAWVFMRSMHAVRCFKYSKDIIYNTYYEYTMSKVKNAWCIYKNTMSKKKYAWVKGALNPLAAWTLRLGALLTVISIRMISMASVETQRWSFEDVCEELFHPDTWILYVWMSFWSKTKVGDPHWLHQFKWRVIQ